MVVKIYERGAFIEACYDNFFVEYDITNMKQARLLEKIIKIRIIGDIILYYFIKKNYHSMLQ